MQTVSEEVLIVNQTEKDLLAKELREMLDNPWSQDPEGMYISALLREARQKNRDIPQYPDYIYIGGDKYTSTKGLSRLGGAFLMWDDFGSHGFKVRQVLLEDGRGQDCSSGGFTELLDSLGVSRLHRV